MADALVIAGETTGTLSITTPNVDEHTAIDVKLMVGAAEEMFTVYIVNEDAPEITLTGETTYNVTEVT